MKIYKIGFILSCVVSLTAQSAAPEYREQNGLVVIEAEDFASQHLTEKRRWMIFSDASQQHEYADNDLLHLQNASSGAYIEILPDTRTNHSETLVRGENFSAIPGALGVLTYPVYFSKPGIYYVWARAFSTGSEDNGVHIGLNGTWPEASQRLQLCENKHQWTWSSAQRTKDNHCGEPKTITLDIPEAGVHMIMISMREDGFELDKLLLTQDNNYIPSGQDKAATLSAVSNLPTKQWLKGIKQYKKILYAANDFTIKDNSQPEYLNDKSQNLSAIKLLNNNQLNEFVYAQYQIDKKDKGTHQLTLVALTSKVASRYKILLNEQTVAEFNLPASDDINSEVYFNLSDLELTIGDTLQVGYKAMPTQKQSLPNLGAKWRALVIGTQE